MFRRSLSESGALVLRWPAVDAAAMHVWVLLVDPERVDPEHMPPDAILRELIRVPVAPGSGEATIYVPAGRVIGLALVARDAHDEPLEAPPFELAEPRPTPTRPGPARPVPPAPPERPPSGVSSRPDGFPPLVFAHPGETPRSGAFESLAHRVAAHAAVPAPKAPAATGFGTRQRFYLTRIAFPNGYEGPRVAIIRRTFIGEQELDAWTARPPDEAHALPQDADGFVDALTPDDEMGFYAVLQGPTPWRALPLTPIQPPFESCRRPAFIGDARARLGPWLRGAPMSGPQRELLEAALRGAPL